LIAPKKVPQKHNGILKFAQFIYFLQQLACLFCTITFPSLYLWTMPMDHLAWIMSWVPFFIQVPFFPFWWANENKSSLLTHERILVLFSWWKKKMILPITYYLLYFVWRNITLSFVFVFFLYSELGFMTVANKTFANFGKWTFANIIFGHSPTQFLKE
jgi:hypothetical protein